MICEVGIITCASLAGRTSFMARANSPSSPLLRIREMNAVHFSTGWWKDLRSGAVHRRLLLLLRVAQAPLVGMTTPGDTLRAPRQQAMD